MMGMLEDGWGDASALPSLQRLNLAFNAFYNQLPTAWGANGSFPTLKSLNLSSNYLTGATSYLALSSLFLSPCSKELCLWRK